MGTHGHVLGVVRWEGGVVCFNTGNLRIVLSPLQSGPVKVETVSASISPGHTSISMIAVVSNHQGSTALNNHRPSAALIQPRPQVLSNGKPRPNGMKLLAQSRTAPSGGSIG